MMNYLVGVLALPAAMAWWDGGHYISGAIARRTLLEQDKADVVEWVESILALDPQNFGNHSTFLTAPTWMDDVRPTYTSATTGEPRQSFRTWDSNHFMNIPIEDNCHGTCIRNEDNCQGQCIENDPVLTNYLASGVNNIDVLLGGALAHLAPEGGIRNQANGMLWGTQLHLRWLFHTIGDSHMPLHMTGAWYRGLWECPSPCNFSWCTQCQEHSNQPGAEEGKTYLLRNHHCSGGNAIQVEYDRANWPTDMDIVDSTNLHGFWDSMGGFAQKRSTDLTSAEKEALADIVREAHPFDEMKKKYNIWGNNWTLRKDVYPAAYEVAAFGAEDDVDSNGKPWYVYMDVDVNEHMCFNSMSSSHCLEHRSLQLSEEYRQFAERASKRLVALAGYRLADALSRMVEGLPPRIKSDITRRIREQEKTCGATSLMTLGAGLLVTGILMVIN